MKTILRILVIVFVGVLVFSALYLTVENTSLFSDTGGFPDGAPEFRERPEMPDDGEMSERPEGDHDIVVFMYVVYLVSADGRDALAVVGYGGYAVSGVWSYIHSGGL